MNLNEYQAKRILRQVGVPVASGQVCESADSAADIAHSVCEPPWLVKAQIPAGGRAEGHFKSDPQARGGIRVAETVAQLVSHVRQMLGGTLVTNQTGPAGAFVSSVYIEQKLEIRQEYFLALAIDPGAGELVLLASPEGGIHVESAIASSPERLVRLPLSIRQPPRNTSSVCDALAVPPSGRAALNHMITSLYEAFLDRDMLLLEVNPLALLEDDTMIALDARVVFDDNALFRQGHEEELVAYEHLSALEYDAAVKGLNYMKLDGNVGILAAGAGLALATLDAVRETGASPANFLEIAPSSSTGRIVDALNLLLLDEDVDCLLLNIFGGGIMRCDAVADAILLANTQSRISKPLVVRLAGTNASLAHGRLKASLPSVLLATDLADGARVVAEIANTRPTSEDVEARPLWKKLINKALAD